MKRGVCKRGKYSSIEWEPDDIAFMRANVGKMCLEDIAVHFGVSTPTVSTCLRRLGITVSRKRSREWSDSEISYLREHFPYETANDIADHIGVSEPCLLRKARELGLRKDSSYNRYAFSGRYTKRYQPCQQ